MTKSGSSLASMAGGLECVSIPWSRVVHFLLRNPWVAFVAYDPNGGCIFAKDAKYDPAFDFSVTSNF